MDRTLARAAPPSGVRDIVATATAFVVLGLVAVTVHLSTVFLMEEAAWVQHSHEVVGGVQSCLMLLRDADAARRDFRASGNEAFLAQVRAASAAFAPAQQHVRALVSDDAEQLARLRAFEPVAAAYLRSINDEVAKGRRGAGEEPDAQRAAPDPGAVTIRAAIADLILAQRTLLTARQERTRKALGYARTAQAVGAIVAVVLLTWGLWRTARERRMRKRFAAELVGTERNLAATLESIGDGVIATDLDGRVVSMSRVAERLTGWSAAEARGRRCSEVFALIDVRTRAPAPDPVTKALACHATVSSASATVLLARDGVEYSVADTAAPILDHNGDVAGIVLAFRDVTTARTAEAALKSAHVFLDSVIEHIPHMVFVKGGSELRFMRMNRAGEELLGVPRTALLGKNDFDLFPVDQAAAFVAKDREALAGGRVVDIVEEPLDTTQGLRWLHTLKVPLVAEDGTQLLLGISEDITERREAAELLRIAQDDAERAHRELEAFSYSVAHDLRAPLRSIDGFSMALLEDHSAQLDERGTDLLMRVRRAAGRMASLIDDLLKLSRITKHELQREPIPFSRLAQVVVADVATRYERGAVVIEDGLVADGDPELVRVLLENLLDNAFKFSQKATVATIDVGALRDSSPPTFYVRDSGAGFDSASATTLFAPFQRFHRQADFDGTGIGLATVQRIVERHGGRIRVESGAGQGATFFFTLATRRDK